MHSLQQMASDARQAALNLAVTDIETRNAALLRITESLYDHREEIFMANHLDLQQAEEEKLAAPMKLRLAFHDKKLSQVIRGIQELITMPDPLGMTTLSRELANGLNLYRVTCPIGVIGVVFESRPDALVQISGLALKSGNAVILKGGREALRTNTALCNAIHEAGVSAGIHPQFIQLLTSREEVADMLKQDSLIDLIIPRGSNAFVRYIKENSLIPVLGHADGICHVYVDEDADTEMAMNICMDSKMQNVSVCNAMETLLVHERIAAQFLPEMARRFNARGVRLLGDHETVQLIHCEEATEKDWMTEYLDATLSIRIVPSIEEAIRHINHYGSHHTDCIVTENQVHAALFLQAVDSAGVYHNCSTRFADGYVYGFGAEVGIATGKIHARGPMGMEGLTSYKYKLLGHGQTMDQVVRGQITYTHRELHDICPE